MTLIAFLASYKKLPDAFDSESAWRAALTEFKKALAEFWEAQGHVVEWKP